ncbi:hypothetical protein [Methyloglobulus sp.]|uniref:hypothetical protein n=1 Tax=Methyloglobulus sp. TaxID=2518622 RepID=UPI00398928F7
MTTSISGVPPDVLQLLEAKIRAMAEFGVNGDKVSVARFYADNALITDMGEMWVMGREPIDRYWVGMPSFQEWHLTILDTGGHAEAPYQRLRSTAWLEIDGNLCVDMGQSLVVWKKQSDGDYRIYVDIYRLTKFEEPKKT